MPTARKPGDPIFPDTPTTPLQRKAALRAERLLSQMGSLMQMEDSPRYRENMLGKRERFPMTSAAEGPMRNLNRATALARDTRAHTRTASKGGF
jgi:hypothetical protein